MSEAIIPYFFEPLDYLSPRGVNLALGMFLGMSWNFEACDVGETLALLSTTLSHNL